MKFRQCQCGRGGHDSYLVVLLPQNRRLQSRFNTDDRYGRILLSQCRGCNTCGGVAGDDNRLHILCEKKIGTLLRSLKNSLSGLCSVRCVCRIAKIYIIFTGHELHDVAENAYSA